MKLYNMDFMIESTCPSTLSPNSIVLPVADYDPRCTKMIVHAISQRSYPLRSISFQGAFIGAPVAPNEYDELAVFVATDIVHFTGMEFGFRLSLKNNILYGYVQDDKFFKNIRLMNGDGIEHQYSSKVQSSMLKEQTNIFHWSIDGEVMGNFSYDGPDYTQAQYHIICTTHRKEAGWSSKGLWLNVSDIKID
jgi:hypothetical protein